MASLMTADGRVAGAGLRAVQPAQNHAAGHSPSRRALLWPGGTGSV